MTYYRRSSPNRDTVSDSRRLKRSAPDVIVTQGRFRKYDRRRPEATIEKNGPTPSQWRGLWRDLLDLLKRLKIRNRFEQAYRHAVDAVQIRIIFLRASCRVEWTSSSGIVFHVAISANNRFVQTAALAF